MNATHDGIWIEVVAARLIEIDKIGLYQIILTHGNTNPYTEELIWDKLLVQIHSDFLSQRDFKVVAHFWGGWVGVRSRWLQWLFWS